MTKRPTSFSVNERVQHAIYGLGTIKMVDDDRTIIEFDQNGRRKFVSTLIQIEHSDVEAPKRTRNTTRKPKAGK